MNADMHTNSLPVSSAGFRRLVRHGLLIVVTAILAFGAVTRPEAAPQAERWERWEPHAAEPVIAVDHSAWQRFLDTYLVAPHPSGVHRVRYADVSGTARAQLDAYVAYLTRLRPAELTRDQQIGYWLNLYNAVTVQLILDAYPTSSIRRLGGAFILGPWDDPVVRVDGVELSLNDIEHRIIRPIWQDPRIHYVVNCASIGCPNLYPEAITADTWADAFEQSAADYIGHPRGVRFDGNTLVLSSIYDWYVEDFGGDVAGVQEHVAAYLPADVAARIRAHTGRIRYEYDWSLNEP